MPEPQQSERETLTFDMLAEMLASLPPHRYIPPNSFQVRITEWALKQSIVVLDPNMPPDPEWPVLPWKPLVVLLHPEDATREDSPQLVLAAIAEFWRRRAEGLNDA